MVSEKVDRGSKGGRLPASAVVKENRGLRLGWPRLAWLRLGLGRFVRAYAALCAEEHLAELDDRLLKDIGLSRREIRQAVRGRRPAAPRTVYTGKEPAAQ